MYLEILTLSYTPISCQANEPAHKLDADPVHSILSSVCANPYTQRAERMGYV